MPPAPRGPVAQLGARFHGMEEVVGSIPTRSTKLPNNLDGANRVAEGQDGFSPSVVFSLRFSISHADPGARGQPFSGKRIWVGLHYPIARGVCGEAVWSNQSPA